MKKQKYLESEKLSVLLFLFMFLLYAVVYMTKNMFSSAMAVIVEEGFMTKSQTGLINAVFWLVYAPFQVIGGFAVDKYSPYKLIMIGLGGSVIANMIIYFNQSYPVMMGAWVFNAIIQFGVWPGVFKIVSTQIAPQMRGSSVFWLMFSTSVGLGLSMLIASFVTYWQHNFLVSIISVLIMMTIYAFLNPFLEKRMIEAEVESDRKTEGKKEPMMALMISSGLIVFMVICLLRVAIDNGIKMMTPVMLMESYKELPAAISTRMSSVLIIFSALGTFISGIVQKKITGNETKAQVFLFSLSLLPLIAVCFLGRIHYIWILIALSVAVMLVHGASAFSQSFVAVRFEKQGRIGTVSGILNATASIGNILASYVFARMAETMPWVGVTLTWLVTIVVCGLLCLLVMRRWTRFIED